MTGNRILIHTTFVLLLRIIVAGLSISLAGAIALVGMALVWRWAISLSAIIAPASVPELELETISASHFVEKVRWCMDRLGVEYSEKPAAGTLGAFFLGRSVPVLRFHTGMVRSSIGNSSEILRYLWGRYAAELGEAAAFLEATRERLELEKRIDRCGVDLQVWIYHHILKHRELTLHAWGCNNPAIPAWQRLTLKMLFPVLAFLIRKSFRITPKRHEKAVQHVSSLLADVNSSLADGRKSILGGETVNFSDIAFAAIMGLWLQPEGYGGGKADAALIGLDRTPARMREEIETWSRDYPASTAFIREMYQSRVTP
jgi:glutathione S-transferase